MTATTRSLDARIDSVDVSAYEVPTATEQESDGTLVWASTTIVVVELHCGEHTGLGYTYAHPAVAAVVQSKLASVLEEADPLMPQQAWAQMQMQARQLGHAGIAAMAIAAGEYGWNLPYFEQMLDAQAVHILQADVTRCGGITNMLRVDGLCKARNLPFSAHCAPAISAHVCCAMETVVHIEYFFDHYRIESMLFEGTLDPNEGLLTPDRSRLGLGLELKRADASRYEV